MYFYQSRFYDPMAGRFVSADTIVPDLRSPLAWDRFSYVQNNPIIFVDPTGYKTTPGDEIPGCHNYYCPFQAPPITITVPDPYKRTQEEAKRYEALANSPKIWAAYGGYGNFTVQDYYQLLLSMEFSGMDEEQITVEDLQELAARDFFERCTGFCNTSADFDLLRYIAIKKLNKGERNLTPQSFIITKQQNSTDFVSAITNPNQAWKAGCSGGNVVCNWGNKKMVAIYIAEGKTDSGASTRFSTMSASYVPRSTKSSTFYLLYGEGEDTWIALTANQANCLYGGLCQ